jgi:DNA-binding XRE family transcriptional regulator
MPSTLSFVEQCIDSARIALLGVPPTLIVAHMSEELNGGSLEAIGSRVKRLRMERRLSQDRLAIEAHVDQSGLSKFERGKERNIGEPALRRMAAVLRISFEELIAGTDFELL